MFDVEFEPTHEGASRARREARGALDAAGVPSDIANDLELIVAELASNAVEQCPTERVKLDLVVVDGSILLTVANRQAPERAGAALPLESRLQGQLPDRGRGLAIVEALADEVWIDTSEGWTSVRCARLLRGRNG